MQAEPDATQMVNSRPAVQAGSRPAAPKMELRGISKKFSTRRGEVVALAECNLAVEKAEFVTVVGPSGCGKSTLLMIAAGLTEPTTGEDARARPPCPAHSAATSSCSRR